MIRAGVAKLIAVQSGVCAYCGAPFLDSKGKLSPTLDHVWPRSNGHSRVDNVLAVHRACNKRKGRRKPNACELIMLSAVNLKRTCGCAGTIPGQPASAIDARQRPDTEEWLDPKGESAAPQEDAQTKSLYSLKDVG